MRKVLLILGAIAGIFLSLGPANSELITNRDFSNGLSGWSISNPGFNALGIQRVDIDGAGPLQSSDAFFVQTGGGLESRATSIFQSITIPTAGAYTLSADVAASYSPSNPNDFNNLSGGIITVALNGRTIASHDFKEIAANSWEFASLSASFVAASTGILDINFFRPFKPRFDSPINYLDNVLLVSQNAVTAPVPEASTVLLLATGLAGLAGFGRKKFLNE